MKVPGFFREALYARLPQRKKYIMLFLCEIQWGNMVINSVDVGGERSRGGSPREEMIYNQGRPSYMTAKEGRIPKRAHPHKHTVPY